MQGFLKIWSGSTRARLATVCVTVALGALALPVGAFAAIDLSPLEGLLGGGGQSGEQLPSVDKDTAPVDPGADPVVESDLPDEPPAAPQADVSPSPPTDVTPAPDTTSSLPRPQEHSTAAAHTKTAADGPDKAPEQHASLSASTPERMDGNVKCSEIAGSQNWYQLDVHPSGGAIGGQYLDLTPPGVLIFNVSNFDASTVTFDWSAALNGVDAVIVKGGNFSNVYLYDPEASSDTGLTTPINMQNDKPYGLSHVSVCYDDDETTSDSPDNPGDQPDNPGDQPGGGGDQPGDPGNPPSGGGTSPGGGNPPAASSNTPSGGGQSPAADTGDGPATSDVLGVTVEGGRRVAKASHRGAVSDSPAQPTPSIERQQASDPTGVLAFTGLSLLWVALTGLALLAAGTWGLLALRRRSRPGGPRDMRGHAGPARERLV